VVEGATSRQVRAGTHSQALKQGGVLIATIQTAVSDADLLELRNALVQQVIRYRSCRSLWTSPRWT